jgi:SAM-dependent methyltransferase
MVNYFFVRASSDELASILKVTGGVLMRSAIFARKPLLLVGIVLALAMAGVAPTKAQDSPFQSKKIVRDTVYDLGSGDGRIVIAAAKKGARAVGFDIDPDLIKEARENIKKAGVEKLAEIREQDILTVDLSPASVVTMYLLPDVNLKLRPHVLTQMKPGSRVVSHAFDMGDWKPEKTERVNGRTIYLWTVPAKK